MSQYKKYSQDDIMHFYPTPPILPPVNLHLDTANDYYQTKTRKGLQLLQPAASYTISGIDGPYDHLVQQSTDDLPYIIQELAQCEIDGCTFTKMNGLLKLAMDTQKIINQKSFVQKQYDETRETILSPSMLKQLNNANQNVQHNVSIMVYREINKLRLQKQLELSNQVEDELHQKQILEQHRRLKYNLQSHHDEVLSSIANLEHDLVYNNYNEKYSPFLPSKTQFRDQLRSESILTLPSPTNPQHKLYPEHFHSPDSSLDNHLLYQNVIDNTLTIPFDHKGDLESIEQLRHRIEQHHRPNILIPKSNGITNNHEIGTSNEIVPTQWDAQSQLIHSQPSTSYLQRHGFNPNSNQTPNEFVATINRPKSAISHRINYIDDSILSPSQQSQQHSLSHYDPTTITNLQSIDSLSDDNLSLDIHLLRYDIDTQIQQQLERGDFDPENRNINRHRDDDDESETLSASSKLLVQADYYPTSAHPYPSSLLSKAKSSSTSSSQKSSPLTSTTSSSRLTSPSLTSSSSPSLSPSNSSHSKSHSSNRSSFNPSINTSTDSIHDAILNFYDDQDSMTSTNSYSPPFRRGSR